MEAPYNGTTEGLGDPGIPGGMKWSLLCRTWEEGLVGLWVESTRAWETKSQVESSASKNYVDILGKKKMFLARGSRGEKKERIRKSRKILQPGDYPDDKSLGFQIIPAWHVKWEGVREQWFLVGALSKYIYICHLTVKTMMKLQRKWQSRAEKAVRGWATTQRLLLCEPSGRTRPIPPMQPCPRSTSSWDVKTPKISRCLLLSFVDCYWGPLSVSS